MRGGLHFAPYFRHRGGRILMGILGTSLLVLIFSGCSNKEYIEPTTEYVVLDRPSEIPPGVVRYCWEEPMVQYEPNGPGLDVDGEWYHPAYMAVREVRMGKWRPCSPVPSESKGETSNER